MINRSDLLFIFYTRFYNKLYLYLFESSSKICGDTRPDDLTISMQVNKKKIFFLFFLVTNMMSKQKPAKSIG